MQNIRNIAVLGHGKSGKTGIVEAMLYNAGEIKRLGRTADGTTTSDYDSEEIKRQCSINTTIESIKWKEFKYNVIDTPGFFDFAGDIKAGVRAADSALIVLSGRTGV
ncbi:MAG: GTP-binding protein, partial [Candidatus Ornithomonoglobus sp.]